MADPIAKRPGLVSWLIRPTMIAGLLVALITVGTPTVLPLGCGITWTRTGGVFIYTPDCSQQSPPSPPDAPDAPPPDTPPTP